MTGPRPWLVSEGEGARRHAPATLRNREPIAEILARLLPAGGTVLEIASGSGEHAAFFAERFPDILWQPSDCGTDALESIAAWCAGMANVAAPVLLDAGAGQWPVTTADAIFCANMTHISPWEATLGLLAGSARVLVPGGRLILYGPYLRRGVETGPSNAAFDRNLKERDARWGLREEEEVARAAAQCGLIWEAGIDMPANNRILLLRNAGA